MMGIFSRRHVSLARLTNLPVVCKEHVGLFPSNGRTVSHSKAVRVTTSCLF